VSGNNDPPLVLMLALPKLPLTLSASGMTSDEGSKELGGFKYPKPNSASDWVFIASFYEELINKELKLTSDRIGWMITSQSILFGAFCLIILNDDGSSSTIKRLSIAIPFIALAIIYGTFMGVNAARRVLTSLGKVRIQYQDILETMYSPLPMPRLGPKRANELSSTVFHGELPFYLVIACLTALWVVVLVDRLRIQFVV
jgi:hypothetical protein